MEQGSPVAGFVEFVVTAQGITMSECIIPQCSCEGIVPYGKRSIYMCDAHSKAWHLWADENPIEQFCKLEEGEKDSKGRYISGKKYWTTDQWFYWFKHFCSGYVKGSPLKGVTRERNRWRARRQCNGQEKTLGWFDTDVEAHLAYRRADRCSTLATG